MTRLAAIISYVFHPLMMVTYALLLYYTAFPTNNYFFHPRVLLFVAMFFVLTFIIPALSVFLLMRFQKWRDMQLEARGQRLLPILYTAMMYLVIFFMLRSSDAPDFIKVFQLGSVFCLLFAAAISLRWKISLHMIGVGGLAGAVLGLWAGHLRGYAWGLAIIFLVAGMIGTARLLLNAHRPAEIYTGFLLGFALEFLAIFYFSS